MLISASASEIRANMNGEPFGFVPTMGALHEGHLALVRRAKQECGRAAVSIFVNPRQFAPGEDFAAYPRDIDGDAALLRSVGCDALYVPEARDMYGEGFAVTADPGPLGRILEGEIRPHFFTGVLTVVLKLFLRLLPEAAYFGEKDYQQLTLVKRMAADLDVPVRVIGCPVERDPTTSIALSSRNRYLSPERLRQAALLPQLLHACAERLGQGADAMTELSRLRADFLACGLFERLDYAELLDAETMGECRPGQARRLLAVVRMDGVRLLDNVPVAAV